MQICFELLSIVFHFIITTSRIFDPLHRIVIEGNLEFSCPHSYHHHCLFKGAWWCFSFSRGQYSLFDLWSSSSSRRKAFILKQKQNKDMLKQWTWLHAPLHCTIFCNPNHVLRILAYMPLKRMRMGNVPYLGRFQGVGVRLSLRALWSLCRFVKWYVFYARERLRMKRRPARKVALPGNWA